MNTRFLLLISAVAVLTSCSTMYKSGQTPDDVYYSPAKDRVAVNSGTDDRKRGYDEYSDVSSRYLRMKSTNRNRWSAFDDDYMYWNDYRWNNPYAFNSWYSNPMSYMNYGYGFGYGHMGYSGYMGYSYYSNPWFWNNPFGSIYYGSPVIILNPKPVYRNPLANGPRTYNLNTYSNASGKGYNPEYTGRNYNPSYSGSNAPVRVFSGSGSTSGSNRGGRYINTGSNGSYRSGSSESRNSNPVRTFDNNSGNRSSGGSNSGGSRSSGSSSGGSAPVRSFPRGG